LPEKIRWRLSKAPFSPDYVRRYNEKRLQVRTLLDEIRQTDPIREIVDVSLLQDLLNTPMTSNRGEGRENFAGMQIVPRGLFLITFLRQFEEFRSGNGKNRGN
jgi:hypothetical protein